MHVLCFQSLATLDSAAMITFIYIFYWTEQIKLWNKFVKAVLLEQCIYICNLAFQISKMLSAAAVPIYTHTSNVWVPTSPSPHQIIFSTFLIFCQRSFDLCQFDRWKIIITVVVLFLWNKLNVLPCLKENRTSFSLTCPCSLPIFPLGLFLTDL